MSRENTPTSSASSANSSTAGPAATANGANAGECRHDLQSAAAVLRAKAEGRLPGRRGAQKRPTKVAVTLRYSREVLEYFKGTGEGWQTRMNEALREYVEQHRTA
ncbi:MAG: BrnA antitoxin family protein [Candidatus Accumulibacter sp.]|mgnify:CR=1 FL=1|uniref:BrnA antitoxin family protein n=1 Tax=Accumulibacter sp. TaxID=2053492 RepID=UPI001A052728|nr:BrnA antitoxin family protein [Accumulibacter sp.]MBE2258868.1 BrnA antitoxin family protein [Paracoccaceae bacterium]MCB1942440.1 BrnA antitoxin family protein [Accumulibacter sp.]MCP5248605.1 BrnA antitoxin family protein [Accumulibacter sp.]